MSEEITPLEEVKHSKTRPLNHSVVIVLIRVVTMAMAVSGFVSIIMAVVHEVGGGFANTLAFLLFFTALAAASVAALVLVRSIQSSGRSRNGTVVFFCLIAVVYAGIALTAYEPSDDKQEQPMQTPPVECDTVPVPTFQLPAEGMGPQKDPREGSSPQGSAPLGAGPNVDPGPGPLQPCPPTPQVGRYIPPPPPGNLPNSGVVEGF